ncbi:hypothetical protein HNR44_000814 [Geomicrobium halophilum]|uniref:Maltodextrin utilization protein YvdJ n=1 Tax=Geomicrobium halophilum TaxID=549000 RepID=A0A841PXV3_9BACL|nr:hypothetical protein [Geomicrobium halophilum]
MSIWKSFFYSLYSPTMIGRFRMQKIGRTILYIFLLVLITSIPAAISISSTINMAGERLELVLSDEIPDYSIGSGSISVEEGSSPYMTQTDGTVIILDDTGEVTPDDVAGETDVTALLDDRVLVMDEGEQNEFAYGEFSFTKEELQEATASFLELLPAYTALALLLLYLLASGVKFLGVFAISGIGLLLKKIRPTRLQYRHIWVMSAYIATLPTVVGALLDTFIPEIDTWLFNDFSFILYWLMVLVIFILVLRTLPKQKPHQ